MGFNRTSSRTRHGPKGTAKQVTFENLSGGGGGRAGEIYREPQPLRDALLISSTPSSCDLYRVCSRKHSATYGLLLASSVITAARSSDSDIQSFEDLVTRFKQDLKALSPAVGQFGVTRIISYSLEHCS